MKTHLVFENHVIKHLNKALTKIEGLIHVNPLNSKWLSGKSARWFIGSNTKMTSLRYSMTNHWKIRSRENVVYGCWQKGGAEKCEADA